MKKIVLTISILVSDRPDTVEKCLKSLTSLREKVSCELILTDTGCGEKVRNIIEHYADVVLEFEWCKDFAKARNLGLRQAKGEWFLYLDDDEWFEDTKEIEDFFLTESYKSYGVANYLQRNYSNKKGTVYSDAQVTRMVKLTSNISFQYSIHETFRGIRGKHKFFSSYVHHYGYIYESERDKRQHSLRNIEPLLIEHKKAPSVLRHHVQLAQEYNGIREISKSIEISFNGINAYRPKISSTNNLSALMANVLFCYSRQFKYEDVVLHAERFLRHPHLTSLGKIKIHGLLIRAYYETNNYKQSLASADFYRKGWIENNKNKDFYVSQASIFLSDTFEAKCSNKFFAYAILSAIHLDDVERVQEYCSFINLKSDQLFINKELVEGITEAALTKKEEYYVAFLKEILERKDLISVVVNYLQEKVVERKEEKEVLQKEKLWKSITADHWFFDYLRMISSKEFEEKCKYYRLIWQAPQAVLEMWKKLNLKEYVKDNNLPLMQLEDIPFFQWNKAVLVLKKCMAAEEMDEIGKEVLACVFLCENFESPYILWWNLCLLKKKIEDWNGRNTDAEEILSQYGKIVEKYYKFFYREEIIDNRADILPLQFQIAMKLREIERDRGEENYHHIMENLRWIQKEQSLFGECIKSYLEIIEDDYKKAENEKYQVEVEMKELTKALKEKIREFIKTGEMKYALSTIQQLEKFVPIDTDLIEWKEKCLNETIIEDEGN